MSAARNFVEIDSDPATANTLYSPTVCNTPRSATVCNTPRLATVCNTPRPTTVSPSASSDSIISYEQAPWNSPPANVMLLETTSPCLQSPLYYTPFAARIYFRAGSAEYPEAEVNRLYWDIDEKEWLEKRQHTASYKSLDHYIGESACPEGCHRWIEMEVWDQYQRTTILAEHGVRSTRVHYHVPKKTFDKLARGHNVWIQYMQLL